MSFKEIQVPVPWGFVAGKSWGDKNKKLILAFHGIQDNANSFDNLIPLLPKSFHYISFDLPSHGKSSHLKTKGMPSVLDFVLTVKLIVDHLNQEKYVLMGHSFGAYLIIIFTHLYPERVEKLITLEAVHTLPVQPKAFNRVVKGLINLYCKFQKFDEDTAPVYALKEASEKLKSGRQVAIVNKYIPTSILEKTVATLLERGLEPVGNDKYKFATAQHLKYLTSPFMSRQYQVELIESNPITCPHLLIMASEVKALFDGMIEVVAAFKRTNKNIQVRRVEGSHLVHLENPEIVAKYINPFLSSNKL